MKSKIIAVISVLALLVIVFASCASPVKFEISFVSDGETIHTITTSGAEIIQLPQNPEKEGYTFDGWYWDEGTWQKPFTVNSILDAPLTSDMSVYAKWTKIVSEYDILVELNGGTLLESGEEVPTKIEKGSQIGTLPIPEKEYCEFLGWSVNGQIVQLPYTPTADVTFVAEWKELELATITLDANGGSLGDGVANKIKVVIDEYIGNLPTPTRGGYEFLGWYEDGNEKWEVDRKTVVEYDMEIVALWEPLGELVTVEFTTETDAHLDSDIAFVEVIKGQKISFTLEKLPVAFLDGYKFLGWQDANGNVVTLTTVVENDLVLSAMWEEVFYCLDGTENHSWGGWQVETATATCTEPAKKSRVCSTCTQIEYEVTQEAFGHLYEEEIIVSSNNIIRKLNCLRCEEVELISLDNITLNSFNNPITNGEGYGISNYLNLIDGNYCNDRTCSVCPKGSGAFEIELGAKSSEGVYVDYICVSGTGYSSYTVIVTYEDDTIETIGRGSFSSEDPTLSLFEVKATIKQVLVCMESPSQGMDYFKEIATLVVSD